VRVGVLDQQAFKHLPIFVIDKHGQLPIAAPQDMVQLTSDAQTRQSGHGMRWSI
jgi:hypothetical protein